MSRPSWDAAELARSALGEMPEIERAEFLASEMSKIMGLQAICAARNALTERAGEVIADRYANDLIGGAA